MFLSLVASLALGTSLAELKLDPKQHERKAADMVANGIEEAPVHNWEPNGPMTQLSVENKVALTREALGLMKAFLMTEAGQKQWVNSVRNSYLPALYERSASLASNLVYWSTIAKEQKPLEAHVPGAVERAEGKLRAFKADRPRLERERATRDRAVSALDSIAFTTQVKERLTYFLAETKLMPWDAKLVEKDGKKKFVSATLESKPNWWKFCWRAGPEATGAAREFATQWLAEFNAPPSKLSDDK